MRLIILFLLFLFSTSCAVKENVRYIEKPVYVKCKLPDIPKSDLEKINDNMPYDEKLKIILNNCLKIRQENELLREAIELCR